jgi:hypothetical protein
MIFFSDLHSAVAAQICLQNDASPIFQWKSHDPWFFKFKLPLLCHEWSNNDWNEQTSWMFLMLKVIPNVHCTKLKFSPL